MLLWGYAFLNFSHHFSIASSVFPLSWACKSSVAHWLMFQAVGVGSFSGTTAAASAAAIRWIFLVFIGSPSAYVWTDRAALPILENYCISAVIFHLILIYIYSSNFSSDISCICRWVSKDGIGAVGRLLIGLATIKLKIFPTAWFWTIAISPGGRFGNLFDDDPKQWRMYADFIGSAGRWLLLFPFFFFLG